MVSQKVIISNPTGLHLRPAGILCKEALKYQSRITFRFKESTCNAGDMGWILWSGRSLEVGNGNLLH